MTMSRDADKFDRVSRSPHGHPAIAPSSGFAAAVSDALRAEAAAPKPLPFPWLRALPGLVGIPIVLIVVAIVAGRMVWDVSLPAQVMWPGDAGPLLLGSGALALSWAAMRAARLLVQRRR